MSEQIEQIVDDCQGIIIKNDSQYELYSNHTGAMVMSSNRLGYIYECIEKKSSKCKKHKVDDINKVKLIDDEDKATIVNSNNKQEADLLQFNINERFEFLKLFVQMTIDGQSNSVIIAGQSGIGKTQSTLEVLAENKLKEIDIVKVDSLKNDFDNIDGDPFELIETVKKAEDIDWDAGYVFVKGYSTAKGLFRTLYEFQDKIIIFDDCDKILEDKHAANILKAALDSYDKRVVTWNSEMKESDLPKSFLFKGQVIFITNIPVDKLDKAVITRSLLVDVSATPSEMIERINHEIENVLPNYDLELKKEVLNYLDSKKHSLSKIDFRMFMSLVKIRASIKSDNWERILDYRLSQLVNV